MKMRRSPKGKTKQEQPVFMPLAEKVAKKTYDTLKPSVEKTKKVIGTGLRKYLDVTNSIAKKIEDKLPKNLPKMPTRVGRRRSVTSMKKK